MKYSSALHYEIQNTEYSVQGDRKRMAEKKRKRLGPTFPHRVLRPKPMSYPL